MHRVVQLARTAVVLQNRFAAGLYTLALGLVLAAAMLIGILRQRGRARFRKGDIAGWSICGLLLLGLLALCVCSMLDIRPVMDRVQPIDSDQALWFC